MNGPRPTVKSGIGSATYFGRSGAPAAPDVAVDAAAPIGMSCCAGGRPRSDQHRQAGRQRGHSTQLRQQQQPIEPSRSVTCAVTLAIIAESDRAHLARCKQIRGSPPLGTIRAFGPLVPDPDGTRFRATAARHARYSCRVTRREWLTALAGLSPPVLAAPRRSAGDASAGARRCHDALDRPARRRLCRGPADAHRRHRRLLARIDRENPALGAFVTVTRERAVDDTRRVMTRSRRRPRGPLFGVPIAHKDLLRHARHPHHRRLAPARALGARARRRGRRAPRRAGTVLLGKTNTHELGGGVTTINPFFGTTRNPRDRTRIAGGSSGGSAAAVAARPGRWPPPAATLAAACASRPRCADVSASSRPSASSSTRGPARRLPDLRSRRRARAQCRRRGASARGHGRADHVRQRIRRISRRGLRRRGRGATSRACASACRAATSSTI